VSSSVLSNLAAILLRELVSTWGFIFL